MRTATATRLRLVELARRPTTVGLLALLVPSFVVIYGTALESFQLPGLGVPAATAGRMTGALFGVAFLVGVVGLFQIVGAREGDERLALCGFPRVSLLVSRLAVVLVVAVLGAGVAFATLAASVDVAAPLLAAGALAAAGVLYGLLGAVVGTVLSRDLEGSLVLVFVADIDNALSSGLFAFGTVDVPGVGTVDPATLAPLYHFHDLFEAAVLDGTLATAHLAPAAAWLAGLCAVAVVAYGRSTGVGRWSA